MYPGDADSGEGCVGFTGGESAGIRDSRRLPVFGIGGHYRVFGIRSSGSGPCGIGGSLEECRGHAFCRRCPAASRLGSVTDCKRPFSGPCRGHRVARVDDFPIWGYALDNEAVIVTKDEDFPRRLRQSQRCPVVVWLRIGNTSRRALLGWFEPLLPEIEKLIRQGDCLIEVR